MKLNWYSYIISKFSESSIFSIEKAENEDDMVVLVTCLETGTILGFFFPDSYDSLEFIYFTNVQSPNNKKWFNFAGDGVYSFSTLMIVEDWLRIPLELGWTEKASLYDDIVVRSELIVSEKILRSERNLEEANFLRRLILKIRGGKLVTRLTIVNPVFDG